MFELHWLHCWSNICKWQPQACSVFAIFYWEQITWVSSFPRRSKKTECWIFYLYRKIRIICLFCKHQNKCKNCHATICLTFFLTFCVALFYFLNFLFFLMLFWTFFEGFLLIFMYYPDIYWCVRWITFYIWASVLYILYISYNIINATRRCTVDVLSHVIQIIDIVYCIMWTHQKLNYYFFYFNIFSVRPSFFAAFHNLI